MPGGKRRRLHDEAEGWSFFVDPEKFLSSRGDADHVSNRVWNLLMKIIEDADSRVPD